MCSKASNSSAAVSSKGRGLSECQNTVKPTDEGPRGTNSPQKFLGLDHRGLLEGFEIIFFIGRMLVYDEQVVHKP